MKVIEQLKALSPQRFQSIYEALAQHGFGPLDGEVAKELKFRPQAIKKLPFEQRAKRARLYMERTNNAELCYEVFGTYLMKDHKALITDFLDATGVQHRKACSRVTMRALRSASCRVPSRISTRSTTATT
ncbi:MAG: hypothetical protein R3E96_15435 [Planctomycetota bacterium]